MACSMNTPKVRGGTVASEHSCSAPARPSGRHPEDQPDGVDAVELIIKVLRAGRRLGVEPHAGLPGGGAPQVDGEFWMLTR
jgi:hypothetical protein